MTFDENATTNLTKNDPHSAQLDWRPHDYHRIFSAFDEDTLINDHFQVFTSVLLCIVGICGALLHIGILLQRCAHTKACSREAVIRLLFDCCHLLNILFTHVIIVAVYATRTASLDHLRCPLSTWVFSLASLGSIGFLCVGAAHQYTSVLEKQSMRHRLSAHRIILIASMSWLIMNFPKIDLHETS